MQIEMEVLTDTLIHISEVNQFIEQMIAELKQRAIFHDRSKLEEPEFSVFCATRPEFKTVNFGTPEYAAVAEKAKVAVDHHYQNNRHHTGYHRGGFSDMNLFDLMEMIADWRAASRRSPDLSFEDSLPRAFKKYEISEPIQALILNTIRDMGW